MRSARRRLAVLLALGAVVQPLTPGPGRAQAALAPRPEIRLDATTDAAGTSLEGGVGVDVVAGTYLRLAAVAAGGRRLDGDGGGTARGELVGRFLFDPYRQRRWGMYGFGGLATRWSQGPRRRWRGVVVVGLGAELPGSRARRLAPALELGAAGGGRAGLVLRARRADRR
ncbi:MAG TPA: hypothetical protein VNA89_04225 [Gemmatimonadaceae bacterium]|nr:hypothetical protein [Gemmatimonadaceae bacterium]